MHIRVRVFATLRRYIKDAVYGVPLEVNLPDGASLIDLFNHLNLPLEEVKTAFVNGRARPEDWQLGSGDEVGIFPPVGGG